jgi:hypothetical protein
MALDCFARQRNAETVVLGNAYKNVYLLAQGGT